MAPSCSNANALISASQFRNLADLVNTSTVDGLFDSEEISQDSDSRRSDHEENGNETRPWTEHLKQAISNPNNEHDMNAVIQESLNDLISNMDGWGGGG
jgi:hypothetical protein